MSSTTIQSASKPLTGISSTSYGSGNMSSISQKDLDKLKSKLEALEGKSKQSSQDRAAWTAEKAQLDNQVKKLTKANQLLEKEVRTARTLPGT